MPPATLELFTSPEPPSTPPKPQCSRSLSRRPAPANPTVIPSRNCTQPVLFIGKPQEDPVELTNSETVMDTEQSEKAVKRKSPEKPRTNKHKKHK